MEEVLGMAQDYLPEETVSGNVPPIISYTVFSADARGYPTIVIDPLYAIEKGESLKLLFAHETFHYYRGKILAYDWGSIRKRDERILNVLDQIQNEGIADQIDKRITYYNGGEMENSERALRYKGHVKNSPSIIHTMDSLMQVILVYPEDYQELGTKFWRAVPQSGHPTGYFMTNVILESYGKNTLVKYSYNPFAFFYLYNKAAKENPVYQSFSENSMALIRKLERLYAKEPSSLFDDKDSIKGFDLSGLDHFWKIMDILEKDVDPSPQDWNDLFSTNGYQEIIGREGRFNPDSFIKYFTLAFKPSQNEEREKLLNNGGDRYLSHYSNIKNQKDRLITYFKQLKSGEYFNKVLKEVESFLPAGDLKKQPTPPIAFIVYINDLHYAYKPMIIDILYALDNKEVSNYFINYYTFRYYRNKLLSYEPAEVLVKDGYVIDFIDGLQFKGLLQQFNNYYDRFSSNPSRKETVRKEFPLYYEKTFSSLKEADELMQVIADNPSDYEIPGSRLLDILPLDGYPAGLSMADAIKEKPGKEKLVQSAGNPFEFFRLYNQAARLNKEKYYVFSEKTMNLLNRLEERY